MNVNRIDIAYKKPVNVTPMTPAEARECTELIRKDLATIETIRVRLLDMEKRQGFIALGYSSWREWAIKEYSNSSQAYLYRLLAAAKVESNLTADSTIVEIDIPIIQLTKLAKLPAPQQPVALQKADELAAAENKPRTINHITRAVNELMPPKEPKLPKHPTQTEAQSEQRNLEALIPPATSLQQFIPPVLSYAVEACLEEFVIPRSLDEPFQGKVYLSLIQALEQWVVNKLLKAYKVGEIEEAIALLPLSHQVFIEFADYAICPLPENLVVVYLGKRIDKFIFCFEKLGAVWHRYRLFSLEKRYHEYELLPQCNTLSEVLKFHLQPSL